MPRSPAAYFIGVPGAMHEMKASTYNKLLCLRKVVPVLN
jgi:hypothetical protein